ncbi:hypothetical protein RDABS01_037134 [Bienertia sinuspersici]
MLLSKRRNVGPPKLKHFIWRACHGMLAVKERFFYRHITNSQTCQLCGDNAETIVHSIFWCKYAREIWLRSDYRLMLDVSPSTCFAEILLWVTEKLSSSDLTTFMALAWLPGAVETKLTSRGLSRIR